MGKTSKTFYSKHFNGLLFVQTVETVDRYISLIKILAFVFAGHAGIIEQYPNINVEEEIIPKADITFNIYPKSV
ncbi:MAG: hypothetical protein K9N09_01955 [Candidatus Cloacimonetes bacterium]|nr:hypothetical protein [Candidatus Cloacimonadota bacterium]MCF7813238.1 hypothetical protein [Candidatus Cloacimonadota bacterium]MCF7867437.1 hypothetical protein [Candidatus Cloacimonadota bacterium]MCF7882931.1 hypothetical protein [Candidatus Cloacimonadota bacterium]